MTYSYDRQAKANDFVEQQLGAFTFRFLKQHEPFAEKTGQILLEAEKKYNASGLSIPHKVLVALYGKGAAHAKAAYWPGSNPPTFQVAPKAFEDVNLLHVMIHELGHYFHDKVVPGGMGNDEVRRRYSWAIRQKRTQGGGLIDVLTHRAKALDKRYFELQETVNLRKPLPRKGQIFEFDEWLNGVQYHIKGRSLGKHDSRNLSVEILEAPQKYLEFQSSWQRLTARPGAGLIVPVNISSLTYAGKDEAKEKELAEVEAERTGVYAELKKAIAQPDDRYEVQQHDWVPTTYSRKNNVEWFAEMMTTYILGHLKPDPTRWLLSVVKTGEAPDDMRIPAPTVYSYDRRTAEEVAKTPTEEALTKLSPFVMAWLKNPHGGKKPLFDAYAGLSDDERSLVSQDVYETFSAAHSGSTVIAYKIKGHPHKGGAAMTTRKPEHLKPEEMSAYLVRAKDVLAHWGQEELPLGEDLIILKPNAHPLPFE